MPKQLTAKQVDAIVARRMRKYEKLNFMEHFALFMGKAQLVERGLKNHLMNKTAHKMTPISLTARAASRGMFFFIGAPSPREVRMQATPVRLDRLH
jgi:hypothetical protein